MGINLKEKGERVFRAGRRSTRVEYSEGGQLKIQVSERLGKARPRV